MRTNKLPVGICGKPLSTVCSRRFPQKTGARSPYSSPLSTFMLRCMPVCTRMTRTCTIACFVCLFASPASTSCSTHAGLVKDAHPERIAQGKLLHARCQKSSIPLENATGNPKDNSSENPLDGRQSFGCAIFRPYLPGCTAGPARDQAALRGVPRTGRMRARARRDEGACNIMIVDVLFQC